MNLNAIRTRARLIAVWAVLAMSSAMSMAQSATPVPPSTPSITIPTDVLFDQAQTWIGVFAPILAVGIGIGIALAILTFVGNKILEAFKG